MKEKKKFKVLPCLLTFIGRNIQNNIDCYYWKQEIWIFCCLSADSIEGFVKMELLVKMEFGCYYRCYLTVLCAKDNGPLAM